MSSIDTAYRQVLAADSDMKVHLPVLSDLVVKLDARRVIELGVRAGTSSVAWLHGLTQTNGRLWGVDVMPAPFLHNRFTFVQGDDTSAEVLAALPDEVDIVFVDSSHRYEHTHTEIDLYAPRIAPGGCMVFHDVAVARFEHHGSGEPDYPVRRAVAEAAMARGWEVDFTERCFGLAVCWPPS